MRKFVVLSLLAAAMLWAGGAAYAHHGYSVAYDTANPVTKTGVVTHLQWTNPHCQVYFDVKEADGKVVNWGIEMTNPRSLVRMGVTPAMFPEGKTVTITFSPSRSGANRGLIKQVVIDGKTMFDERKVIDDLYAK